MCGEVCGAAVESTRERGLSEGICSGVTEETPGSELRESERIVGVNASVVWGRVQAQRGE